MESAQQNAATMSWDHVINAVMMILIPGLSALMWRYLPRISLGRSLSRRVRRWLAEIVEPDLLVTVHEHESSMLRGDVYYEEVKAYLGGSCWRTARGLRAEGVRDGGAATDRLVLSMLDRQEVSDHFRGATFWWSAGLVPTPPSRSGGGAEEEERCFELHLTTSTSATATW
ncbi:unnamed protein product [Urochloa humidicola]